jgi:hypothetical protein
VGGLRKRRLAIVALAVLCAPLPSTRADRATAASSVTFTIDTTADVHPISPYVYGLNGDTFPSYGGGMGWPQSTTHSFTDVLTTTRPTIVRMGGNSYSAFNWEVGDSNHGADYRFANYPLIPDIDPIPPEQHQPAGPLMRTIDVAKAHGAATLVTVPVGDYVAADALDQNADVRSSGANYLQTRFRQNRAATTGALPSTPNTTDAFVYEDQLASFLKAHEADADIWFSLDNEPNDWSSTHEEIHPANVTFDELVERNLRYATALKGVWPTARVTGPVLDGYQGQEDPVQGGNPPSSDFQAHGRFVPYYLQKVHAAEVTAGKRLVDTLDVHWYPQDRAGLFTTGHSPQQVAVREQAPRSLWDPTYVEDSYVTDYLGGGAIRLIPRLREEVAANNPGMGLAVSEWNYGGGGDVSGAIATADTLGIFGREGVQLATYWPQFSPVEDFALGAFKVFRSYDGVGAAFGDTSVGATTSAPSTTSVYASKDAANPGRVVIVAINKSTSATTASIQLTGTQSTSAAVYRLTAAGPDPQPATGLTATGPNTFSYSMPAQSVSVIVPAPVAAGPSGRYTAADPARVLDTRSGLGGPSTRFGPQETRDLQVTGGAVPADATAVVVNMTVTNATAGRFLTVFPSGVARPVASNLNFRAGDTIPNLVTAGVGASGRISIYNEAGNTDVLADLVGYYRPSTGAGFTPTTPTRILDSRSGLGVTSPARWNAGESRDLVVTGGAVPADAVAVAMNVTVTDPTNDSFLTVHPAGSPQPTTSSLNFQPDQTIPNFVIGKVGTGGKVSIYNFKGQVHVIADVVGYYRAGTGAAFTALTPVRRLDTRFGIGGTAAPLAPGATRTLQVTGATIPANAGAVVMNVTATDPTAPSFLTVFPNPRRPTASNLNYVAGQTIPNLVMVGLRTGGQVDLYNFAGQVNVLADVAGYFA